MLFQYAAKANKHVVIGVETFDVPDKEANPPKVTFYQEGEIYMNGEIAKVINGYANAYNNISFEAAAGFKGMAVHYYETYRDLTPGPRSDEQVEEKPEETIDDVPEEIIDNNPEEKTKKDKSDKKAEKIKKDKSEKVKKDKPEKEQKDKSETKPEKAKKDKS